jgi:hypothetical protein
LAMLRLLDLAQLPVTPPVLFIIILFYTYWCYYLNYLFSLVWFGLLIGFIIYFLLLSIIPLSLLEDIFRIL